jgi:hypothetical protein
MCWMRLRVRSKGGLAMTIGCRIRTKNRTRPYIYSMPPTSTRNLG